MPTFYNKMQETNAAAIRRKIGLDGFPCFGAHSSGTLFVQLFWLKEIHWNNNKDELPVGLSSVKLSLFCLCQITLREGFKKKKKSKTWDIVPSSDTPSPPLNVGHPYVKCFDWIFKVGICSTVFDSARSVVKSHFD